MSAEIMPGSRSATVSLFSPTVDLIALGGLSLLTYAAFQSSGLHLEKASWPPLLLAAAVIVNYPHYAATYVKAYRGWDEVRRYWGVCLVVPLVLLSLVALSFLAPARLAPPFCKAYLLASGYHYSGQTYGIAMIFAGKAKMPQRGWQKWFLMAPIYFSYAYLLAQKENTSATSQPFYTMQVQPLGLPAWTMSLADVLLLVGLGLYVALNIYWLVCEGKRFPAIFHVVVGSQVLWFVWGARNPAYNNLVPFFHCLQYLVITSFFHCKKAFAGAAPGRSALALLVTREFVVYYALLVVMGILLFLVTPASLTALGVAEFSLTSAVFVAFLNLHHFLLDGAIWKLRKPEVGKVLLQPVAVGSTH